MKTQKAKKTYSLLIFAAILLFNPNVNVIDPLPDFIAYFIIARLLIFAENAAPYFAEARSAFLRLGYLNLAKLPALLLIVSIRRVNTLDNDVYALASFSFAVFEILLMVMAIRYLFSALFYLGEKTEAPILISPFSVSRDGKFTMTPEELRSFSFLFAAVKCITYTLPDMFLLTRTTEDGRRLSISKFYPYVLLGGLLIGTIVGIIWLTRTKKFIKAIREGEFFLNSLNKNITDAGKRHYEIKNKIRTINSALGTITVASFFTVEFAFVDFDQINVLPTFIYGIILLISVLKISKLTKKASLALYSSIAFILSSVITFIFSLRFHTRFDYSDLMKNETAVGYYNAYKIFSSIQFLILLLTLISLALLLRDFIYLHTGVDRESERYLRMEREYHKSLVKGAYITFGLSALTGAMKLIHVFLNGYVQLIFTDKTDMTMPTIFTGAIPWFNLVVFASAVAYIGYSLYFFSLLKEEVKIKYHKL